MFRFDPQLTVYVHRDAVDFRKNMNGLAALVEQGLGLGPFAAAVYVFRNRRADRVKILGWQHNGFWLLTKRLEADRFVWPRAEQTVITLSVEQLHWLLAGVDLAALRGHRALSFARASRCATCSGFGAHACEHGRSKPAMHMPQHNDEEVKRLREAPAHLTQEHETLRHEVRLLRTERDLLKERLHACLRKLFAAKSEARGANQKDLFFNEAEAQAAAATPSAEEKSVVVPAHKRVKRGRKPLDPALPREVIQHERPAAERVCPHDGAQLQEIGVETSEQLDIIAQQVRVIRHERVNYACPCCTQHLRTAPAPVRLIPKALLTDDALAWIVAAKYQDALPLYRQAAILARFGGDISRSTLAAHVVRAGEAVQPLINLLRDHLFECKLIHGDETELQVLKEPGRAAQRKSFLWVQTSGSGPPVRLFTYAQNRSGATAQGLYDGVRAGAALMSDGFEVYEGIAHAHGLVHLGC